MFLKWRHSSPIFRYPVNFTGCGQSGKFKSWFHGTKASEFTFLFEYTFRCYRDTKTLKNIWPYRHFKVLIKAMNNPLGISPSKGNQGTTQGKEKIFWPGWESNRCSADWVMKSDRESWKRHNSVGRVTVDLIQRSWVRFRPRTQHI